MPKRDCLFCYLVLFIFLLTISIHFSEPTNAAQKSAVTDNGISYVASGYDTWNSDMGFTFSSNFTIEPEQSAFTDAFNRMSLRYSASEPLKMQVAYIENNVQVTDSFYLLAGTNKRFSAVIRSYVSSASASRVVSMSFSPCKASSAQFDLKEINTETIDVYTAEYFVESSKYKVGVDLERGGTIKYIKDKSCAVEGLDNMVNSHDTGRMVQQSYYGTGANSEYTPGTYNNTQWRYNPVQGGDMYGNTSKLIDIDVSDNKVYIKVQPMDWSLNNSLSPSYMENTYYVSDDKITVDNVFTDFSGYQNPVVDQELPAFIIISYLDQFVYYGGTAPWTDGDLTVEPELKFWGDPANSAECNMMLDPSNTETWCAWISSKDNYGIGVYSPGVQRLLAGRYRYDVSEWSNAWLYSIFPEMIDVVRKSSNSDQTNYVAPIKQFALDSYSSIKYSYMIAAGSPEEIRSTFKTNKDFINNEVTFESAGGSSVPVQKVRRGDEAEEPAVPVKKCSKFTGWFLDASCTEKYDFTREVKRDIKLYAGWVDDHDLSAVNKIEATCEDEGAQEHWKCISCDQMFNDAAGKNKIVKPISIPAKGHKEDEPARENVHLPGCIKNGSYDEVIYCSVCGDELRRSNKASLATGHDWGDWMVTKQATTSEEGEEKRTCANDPDHYETRQIEKLPKVDDPTPTPTPVPTPSTPTPTPVPTPPTPSSGDVEVEEFASAHGISPETMKITPDSITNLDKDNDLPGASFSRLVPRVSKTKARSISLKWNNIKEADSYIIFGNMCNTKKKKYKFKKIATLKKGTAKWTHKKLKRGRFYKFMVIACKRIGGKQVTIAASPVLHEKTKGGKKSSIKAIKIIKVKKGKKSVYKKGKLVLKRKTKAMITAKEVKSERKKKFSRHRKILFESQNSKIATVNKKGEIVAREKGKTNIYVYGQNGVYHRLAVIVK